MAPIVIPDDYWTVRPRGFAVLVAGYSDAFRGVHNDVVGAAGGLTGSQNDDTRASLATQDWDAGELERLRAASMRAIETTPTGDVLLAYDGIDATSADADAHLPPEDTNPNPVYTPEPPPWRPGDPLPGDERPPHTPPSGDDFPHAPKHPPGDGDTTGDGTSGSGDTTAPPSGGGTTPAPPTRPPKIGADEITRTEPAPDVAASAAPEQPAPVPHDQLPVTRAELVAALAALDLQINLVV